MTMILIMLLLLPLLLLLQAEEKEEEEEEEEENRRLNKRYIDVGIVKFYQISGDDDESSSLWMNG